MSKPKLPAKPLRHIDRNGPRDRARQPRANAGAKRRAPFLERVNAEYLAKKPRPAPGEAPKPEVSFSAAAQASPILPITTPIGGRGTPFDVPPVTPADVPPPRDRAGHFEFTTRSAVEAPAAPTIEAVTVADAAPAYDRAVNTTNPGHYRHGGIEAIAVITAWGLDFCLGNTVKYISRAGRKEPAKTIEDLEKAAWYLAEKIKQLKAAAAAAAEAQAKTEASWAAAPPINKHWYAVTAGPAVIGAVYAMRQAKAAADAAPAPPPAAPDDRAGAR